MTDLAREVVGAYLLRFPDAYFASRYDSEFSVDLYTLRRWLSLFDMQMATEDIDVRVRRRILEATVFAAALDHDAAHDRMQWAARYRKILTGEAP